MMRWQFLLTTILLAFLMIGCGQGDGENGDQAVETSSHAADHEGGWQDYQAGLSQAKQEGKYVVIDFWTTWCHWCKVMDKETYTDDEVIRRLDKDFVMVKVNAESGEAQGSDPDAPTGRELAREYGVNSYPTTWFIDSDGEKIAPLPGYVEPKQFILVLDFVSSGAYQSQTFQEFQSRQEG